MVDCCKNAETHRLSPEDIREEDGEIVFSCSGCGKVFVLDRSLLGKFTEAGVPEGPKECTCQSCGYSWDSNVDKPKRCPKCGSYKWNVETVKYTCLKCGHRWGARTSEVPIRCPSCRCKTWNEPRKTVLKEAIPSKCDLDPKGARNMMDSAVERCLEGEHVLEVCSEMDVPLLEVIRRLVARDFKYTL